MIEVVIENAAIAVILAVVLIATVITAKARKNMKKAFEQFCLANGLSYSKNVLQLDLPGIESAWFLNIYGSHNTLIRDVCTGIFRGIQTTMLKYQYSDSYKNYLSVFIFYLACPEIPRTFLWTKEAKTDLKKMKHWDVRELENRRLLYSENVETLPEKFQQCLSLLAGRPALTETRFEFLNNWMICIPNASHEMPDSAFEDYLFALTDSVKQMESILQKEFNCADRK